MPSIAMCPVIFLRPDWPVHSQGANMEQGALIVQQLTGSWPVYPGHPLVLATAIMRVFPSFGAANQATEHGWSAALADSRVPGAGDHVGAAMRTLELGSRGSDADAMIEYAARYWEAGQAGGHVKNQDAGRAQAGQIEVRRVLVDGMSQVEAAREQAMSPSALGNSVRRYREFDALIRAAYKIK